jgi:carbonic anhydrase/acetyltransferase-like protein (isoleucine patch superfamily)
VDRDRCINSIGTHIGKRAVVGARSVVSGRVPPYAVVVGNPCKVIKYRFSKEIINKLEKINLNEIDEELLKNNIDLFYKPLTKENLELIIKKIKNN